MSSLVVEEKYISLTPYWLLIILSIPVSTLVFIFTFLIVFPLITNVEIVFVVAFIFAIVYAFLVVGSSAILKRLSRRWSLKGFLKLEKVAQGFVLFAMVSLVSTMALDYFIEIPFWLVKIIGLVLPLMILSIIYADIFTARSRSILYIKQFLEDKKEGRLDIDYGFLFQVSKEIVHRLKEYNMKVNPYSLCLGMSRASLGEESGEDLSKILGAIENPKDPESVNVLLSSAERFMSIAKESKDKGVDELTGISSERLMEFLRYIAIPILVAFLVYVLPEIIEMLKP